MPRRSQNTDPHREWKYKIVLICAWAAILIFCFLNRERLTVDGVLSYTPQNTALAAIFMMLLFALKSMSVFIFSGILFAANGILFPLPEAIGLNVLGAGIMISLPYWLGRQLGQGAVDRLVRKYPKIEALRDIRTQHEFTISFFTRIINVLPSDILSLYMGTTEVHYGKYLAGSLLGMLAPIITFPIMGTSITDPRSPVFLISAGIQLSMGVVSMIGCWIYYRHQKRGA